MEKKKYWAPNFVLVIVLEAGIIVVNENNNLFLHRA